MQYLYILTSTLNDIYYEQFLLSAASLRLIMPNADIVLLCDSETKKTLTGRRSEYEKLVSKTISIDVPSGFSQVEISRWLKTSMRCLLSGDFLFIDCDTIITENLSTIFEKGIVFGACLDKHSLLNKHEKYNYIIQNEKKLKFTSYQSNKHFNSGVIFCADTPQTHKIFSRWHELWLYSKNKNIVRDQPSFNAAIYENISCFTELDGIWNCQIAHNGLPYFASSKIIHYFASDLTMRTSPFLLASENIFKKIKETGIITEEIIELLQNPRAAFVHESRIVAGEELSIINSSFFEGIFMIKQKIPGLFNLLNCLSFAVKKIVKSFIVKKSSKKDGEVKHYN